MASKTQIVCLHEGEKRDGGDEKGGGIDQVFINRIIRTLKPAWIKARTNRVRCIPCGGRSEVIKKMPKELKTCIRYGGHTTLMVWADLDADMKAGNDLRMKFWKTAQTAGITEEQFDTVVFIFPKYHIENLYEFLLEGKTNEKFKASKDSNKNKRKNRAKAAVKELAKRCSKTQADPPLPPSLEWSCKNWREISQTNEQRLKW